MTLFNLHLQNEWGLYILDKFVLAVVPSNSINTSDALDLIEIQIYIYIDKILLDC